MDDEFDNPHSQANLIKWPFYVANVLILGIIVSYLVNRRDGPLDKWEIATCVFAVTLSALLFFVPHLVEYFISIYLPEKRDSSNGEGLPEKTYLELKSLKEDLSDFGVKLEKIPSIVETIAKTASKSDGDSDAIDKLGDELGALRSHLEQPLDGALPEPDPRVTELIASVVALEKAIDRIADDLAERPQSGHKDEPDDEDEEPVDEELEDNLAKVDRILEETQSTEDEDPLDVDEEEVGEDDKEPEDGSETDEFDLGDSDDEPATEDSEDESEDEGDEGEGEDGEDDNPQDEEKPETGDEAKGDPPGVLKGVSQSDVVVAKILPGIGNKVHVRGEGPGLSWDEGVPMSFLEIGKWGWSPSDKSVPLVIQLYKNDEEPDPNGKVELEPGEKVEITPVFAD